MDLTFEEIPEDLWEDWVWLVSPTGLMRAVEEESQPILSSPYQVTSIYTINLPKLVLFDLMWSSRLEMVGGGMVDSNHLHRAARLDVDSVLLSLAFLIQSYPLVLRWNLPPDKLSALAPNLWDDITEPPELLWSLPQELEGVAVDLDSLAIDFFNPFVPSLRSSGVHRSVIGVISAMKSLQQVRAALDHEDGELRQAVLTSIDELVRRGMMERTEREHHRMTERGARMIETEPLSDCLSCRCRIEEVVEYELSGEED